MCRPGEFQRLLFNGNERVDAVKFQSAETPNGLIANLLVLLKAESTML